MKALVKAGPERGLVLEDVPKPQPGPADVLIKVTHAAICGTDLHIYDWNEWAQENMHPPVVVGHEFVGIVEAIGAQVDDIEPGTRVAGEGHIVCGHCRNCRAGDGHLCRSTIGVGIQRDGGFAEYVVIPAGNAYPIPDSVPDRIAAILDPLGNAVHTALSFDLVGEDVLITGAGPIGQMACAVCRHAGARAHRDHRRRGVTPRNRAADGRDTGGARRSGVGARGDGRPRHDRGIRHRTRDVGQPDAVADILQHTNHGAMVALLGLFDHPAEVDLNQAILKGLTIKGIYGREMFDTWYKAVAMLDSGLQIDPIISHHFALD